MVKMHLAQCSDQNCKYRYFAGIATRSKKREKKGKERKKERIIKEETMHRVNNMGQVLIFCISENLRGNVLSLCFALVTVINLHKRPITMPVSHSNGPNSQLFQRKSLSAVSMFYRNESLLIVLRICGHA